MQYLFLYLCVRPRSIELRLKHTDDTYVTSVTCGVDIGWLGSSNLGRLQKRCDLPSMKPTEFSASWAQSNEAEMPFCPHAVMWDDTYLLTLMMSQCIAECLERDNDTCWLWFMTVDERQLQRTNAEQPNNNDRSTSKTDHSQQPTCRWSTTTGRCIRTPSVSLHVRGRCHAVRSTTAVWRVMATRAAGEAMSTMSTPTSTSCYHHRRLQRLAISHHHVNTCRLPPTTTRTVLELDNRRLITWPDVYWRADNMTWRLQTGRKSTMAITEIKLLVWY